MSVLSHLEELLVRHRPVVPLQWKWKGATREISIVSRILLPGWPKGQVISVFCVFVCAIYRSTGPPVRNHVLTSPMRKRWKIWWTRPSSQAGGWRDSGLTRPAPSLASVLHTHTHADSNMTIFSHHSCYVLTPFLRVCVCRPDVRGCHLSVLGDGDPAGPH